MKIVKGPSNPSVHQIILQWLGGWGQGRLYPVGLWRALSLPYTLYLSISFYIILYQWAYHAIYSTYQVESLSLMLSVDSFKFCLILLVVLDMFKISVQFVRQTRGDSLDRVQIMVPSPLEGGRVGQRLSLGSSWQFNKSPARLLENLKHFEAAYCMPSYALICLSSRSTWSMWSMWSVWLALRSEPFRGRFGREQFWRSTRQRPLTADGFTASQISSSHHKVRAPNRRRSPKAHEFGFQIGDRIVQAWPLESLGTWEENTENTENTVSIGFNSKRAVVLCCLPGWT